MVRASTSLQYPKRPETFFKVCWQSIQPSEWVSKKPWNTHFWWGCHRLLIQEHFEWADVWYYNMATLPFILALMTCAFSYEILYAFNCGSESTIHAPLITYTSVFLSSVRIKCTKASNPKVSRKTKFPHFTRIIPISNCWHTNERQIATNFRIFWHWKEPITIFCCWSLSK